MQSSCTQEGSISLQVKLYTGPMPLERALIATMKKKGSSEKASTTNKLVTNNSHHVVDISDISGENSQCISISVARRNLAYGGHSVTKSRACCLVCSFLAVCYSNLTTNVVFQGNFQESIEWLESLGVTFFTI